ncbi:MAG: cytochrome C oxidase subunit IV family protein [Acidimicrobiales bacterium]|nr:cytochrome C oxidase subunit IV family protein [Acidimicrobiales bacterium]
MSTVIEAPAGEHEGEHDDHPTDRKYVEVAIVLGIVTALEVATYFVEMPGAVLIPMLMLMMVFKFFYVAAWFMHLRFDSPMFTKFFVTGLVLATIVYATMLTVFEFWHKG